MMKLPIQLKPVDRSRRSAFAVTIPGQISPQQIEHTGSCTGIWPFHHRQCVKSSSGVVQCCGGGFQYPYIREYEDGTVERGCGPCV